MPQPRGVHDLNDILLRCRIDEDTGCWVWKFGVSKAYGYPMATSKGKSTSARRFSLLMSGVEIPEGWRVVCNSSCDSLCVNPKHCKAVSPSEFNLHLSRKGVYETPTRKAARAIATRKRKSDKLNQELANQIRARVMGGDDAKQVASDFGVSRSHVCAISNGLHWSDRQVVPSASVFSWRP